MLAQAAELLGKVDNVDPLLERASGQQFYNVSALTLTRLLDHPPNLAANLTIDLHPETVSNPEMGYLYEELVRRFSELSNETAGEHFTRAK